MKDENFSTDFKNHIKDLSNKNKLDKNLFPVDVFPHAVQEIIYTTNKALNYPIDFIGSSILFAVSVAIGNSYKAELIKGWQEIAVVYLALVGRSGTNKSHPLSYALNPLHEIDKLNYRKYERSKEEYEILTEMTNKERKENGFDEPVKPFWKQYLISDFTGEALSDVHDINKRGIGVYVDELATWFNNFNRYNKGSEEQFWLSNWSGKSLTINRTSKNPKLIPNPYISVIGTIQPSVLDELAKDRKETGFLERLLFVMPENLKKEVWSDEELDPGIDKKWQNIIYRLLDLELKENDETKELYSNILHFTQEAKDYLFEWQKNFTEEFNKPKNEEFVGIAAKIETYTIRFALILELADYACINSGKKNISINSVKGAIKLSEYFLGSAIRVRSYLLNYNPVEKLEKIKQKIYNNLPEQFTTQTGVKTAIELGIKERTFKTLLKNKELFEKISHGLYEKRF